MIERSRSDLATAANAAQAAERLRHWLLQGPAQLRDGTHAGGVAGALNPNGEPSYVYPEITGYYLHWLADIAVEHPYEAAAAAGFAAEWAQNQLTDGRVPATRNYLIAADDSDWRNGAVFFFDLAMLLRGLCAAHEAGLIELPRSSVQRLIEELALFISPQGDIAAVRQPHATQVLPQRWSTLGGAFELKASSRVKLAAVHLPLPAPLEAACEILNARYADRIAELPLQMLHPTLYFAEGMLIAQPAHWAAIAQLLARCLALMHADGSLPETQDETEAVPRSDIIAQALRLALLLRAANTPGAPDDDAMRRLAEQLIERTSATGTIAFRPDVTPAQPNVWCAMFAEQALRWYARREAGQSLPSATALV